MAIIIVNFFFRAKVWGHQCGSQLRPGDTSGVGSGRIAVEYGDRVRIRLHSRQCCHPAISHSFHSSVNEANGCSGEEVKHLICSYSIPLNQHVTN